MKLSDAVALAKKFESVEPIVLSDAKTALTSFGPAIAEEFPKIGADLAKANAVVDFLSQSNASFLANFDKTLAFLTQLETVLGASS